MADEMAADAINKLAQLTNIVLNQQVFIFALVDYLRERPDYDAARFAALFSENRAKLTPAATGQSSTDAALQALLRAFEGPIQ